MPVCARAGDEVLVHGKADERGSRLALDMTDLSFKVPAAVPCAALTPTWPTRDRDRGQPHFAPEVMMSRRHELRRGHRFWSALARPESETPVTEQVTAERRFT